MAQQRGHNGRFSMARQTTQTTIRKASEIPPENSHT